MQGPAAPVLITLGGTISIAQVELLLLVALLCVTFCIVYQYNPYP